MGRLTLGVLSGIANESGEIITPVEEPDVFVVHTIKNEIKALDGQPTENAPPSTLIEEDVEPVNEDVPLSVEPKSTEVYIALKNTLEIVDANNELTELVEGVKEATDGQTEPTLDPTKAEELIVAVESICKRLGRKGKAPLPSLENYKSKEKNPLATRVAIESLQDLEEESQEIVSDAKEEAKGKLSEGAETLAAGTEYIVDRLSKLREKVIELRNTNYVYDTIPINNLEVKCLVSGSGVDDLLPETAIASLKRFRDDVIDMVEFMSVKAFELHKDIQQCSDEEQQFRTLFESLESAVTVSPIGGGDKTRSKLCLSFKRSTGGTRYVHEGFSSEYLTGDELAKGNSSCDGDDYEIAAKNPIEMIPLLDECLDMANYVNELLLPLPAKWEEYIESKEAQTDSPKKEYELFICHAWLIMYDMIKVERAVLCDAVVTYVKTISTNV